LPTIISRGRFFGSSRTARIQSLEAKVPNSVLNAEAPELILLITSTDNIKPVACVGFAGEREMLCGNCNGVGFIGGFYDD
ncbi:hypothetical protein Golob_019047, partial [Gossypium lobatum]|nr:hypothetical protein [Gossypium lobatum]